MSEEVTQETAAAWFPDLADEPYGTRFWVDRTLFYEENRVEVVLNYTLPDGTKMRIDAEYPNFISPEHTVVQAEDFTVHYWGKA